MVVFAGMGCADTISAISVIIEAAGSNVPVPPMQAVILAGRVTVPVIRLPVPSKNRISGWLRAITSTAFVHTLTRDPEQTVSLHEIPSHWLLGPVQTPSSL